MISPEKIAREEFDEALGRYPALIKSISDSKTPSQEGNGQLTLEQLDKYRFELAPAHYYNIGDLGDDKAVPTPLSHADVVQLVKWKLKHGTFRPNLLKLAESNSPDDIQNTTLEAFSTYKKDSFKPTGAITKLTSLRGIGPATASLLLSVHDAARVPFFSDELYQWMCQDGQKATIKYSAKEYEELVGETRKLIDKMGVDARDVEKVAFVLVREASGGDKEKPKAAAAAAAVAAVNGTSAEAPKREKEKRARRAGPKPPREPTDMTEERKAQLVEIADRARRARVAKRAAKEAARLAKGTKFRERIDAARERKKDEPRAPVKAAAKRKSDVTTRGSESASKRSKRSGA